MRSALIPLAFACAFLLVTAARSLWMRVVEGVNPYVIDHGDAMHRFIAHVFFAVIGCALVYFVAIAAAPSLEARAGLLPWASGEATGVASVVLMALATLWTGYAQISMGKSWRIGIPQEAPPLRTHGPFSVSRNPIFLGMLGFVLGMALWSPSAVTLALLVATYVALEVQIRSEEAFLERQHGEAYRAYCARVRRWL